MITYPPKLYARLASREYDEQALALNPLGYWCLNEPSNYLTTVKSIPDLFGLWALDEGSGTHFADQVGGNHGTLSSTLGVTHRLPALSDGCAIGIDPDNTRNILGGDVLTFPSQAMTIAMWFRGVTAGDNFGACGYRFADIDAPLGLRIDKRTVSDQPSVGIRIDTSANTNMTRSITAAANVWNNAWRLLIITLDHGAWAWYVDGALNGDGTYDHGDGFSAGANGANAILSSHSSHHVHYGPLAIWSRAISAGEVSALWASRETTVQDKTGHYANATVRHYRVGVPGGIAHSAETAMQSSQSHVGNTTPVIPLGTAGPNLSDTMSVLFWMRGTTTPANTFPSLINRVGGTTPNIRGWRIDTLPPGSGGPSIRCRLDTSEGEGQVRYPSATGSASGAPNVWDGQWRQIALVLDQGEGQFFINGSPTGAPWSYLHGEGFGNANGNFLIASGAQHDATFQKVRIFDRKLTAEEIAADYRAGTWTDLSPDVAMEQEVRWHRGIQGNRPDNVVASSGELSFALNNSASNSVQKQGAYSAVHDHKRLGWGFDIPVQLRVVNPDASETVLFTGRLASISPSPDRYGDQVVKCIAYDVMHFILGSTLQRVQIQEQKTAPELIHTIVESLPEWSRPLAYDLDAGLDVYPYVFANLSPGIRAGTVLHRIAASELGILWADPLNRLKWLNRNTLRTIQTSLHLHDATAEVKAATDQRQIVDSVSVTYHPLDIEDNDPANTTLYVTAVPILVPAGETLSLWIHYTDPLQRRMVVGARDVEIDYVATEHEEGSGSDLSGDIAVTSLAFATTAQVTIENSGVVPGWVSLSAIGNAIYDEAPQTIEVATRLDEAGIPQLVNPNTHPGQRPLILDRPYGWDPYSARSLAAFVAVRYASLQQQVQQVGVVIQANPAFAPALTLDVGHKISLSEYMTGLGAIGAFVWGVSGTFSASGLCHIALDLAPASPYGSWQLDVSAFDLDAIL